MAQNRAKNLIIAILFLTTLFGSYQYTRAVKLRRELNNSYNRAFHELVGYVQNVEIMLAKARMTSSPELNAVNFRDISREAYAAVANMGQLPISVGVLSNTQKFMSQVADVSAALARQSTKGITLDEEQAKMVKDLHTFSASLGKSLSELQGDLNNGNFKWENVINEGTKTFSQTSENMPKSFSSIDETFQEMPTLIYDGPFSEHMQNRKALGLTGKNITEQQAIEKVSSFLGKENIKNVKKLADNKNGIIDTYNLSVEVNGNDKSKIVEADVSVKGGHVVWFLYNREVGKIELDINKAKQIGKKFLEDRGYPNMKESYYLESNGVATINYAYTKDGITYYPDLIKVKIALDNGQVVGFEAKGYLMNHTERNLDPPKLTVEQAREKVAKGLDVKPSGLAVIPTDYGTEKFCYEFTGKLDDKDFIVYINAYTGEEEQVLLIINSEEGVLTM